MKFQEFNFNKDLLEGIELIGFKEATPIQIQAIPIIQQGKDIIASAQTGTGKTAAFLLPIIDKIIRGKQNGHTKALVIVPTRELAIQIDQNMDGFAYFTPISSIAVYGGGDAKLYVQEKNALSAGAEIIICTPGRMISHLNMGYVKLSQLDFLVLDEADRMLDMGFYSDIMKIISFLPKKRQTLLFAATMPTKIRGLAQRILSSPAEINIAISKPPEKIIQQAYVLHESKKRALVKYLLKKKKDKTVIVFCSTKLSAKTLRRTLARLDFLVEDIHSDLDQSMRKQVLADFKSRKINILVATDILSRGIDIEDLDMVINYDVPHDAEDYVHRIGRTARAESDGEAITLVTPQERYKFKQIEKLLGKPVPKVLLPKHIEEMPEAKRESSSNKKKRVFRKKRPKRNRKRKAETTKKTDAKS